jgi:hypothetical protein
VEVWQATPRCISCAQLPRGGPRCKMTLAQGTDRRTLVPQRHPACFGSFAPAPGLTKQGRKSFHHVGLKASGRGEIQSVKLSRVHLSVCSQSGTQLARRRGPSRLSAWENAQASPKRFHDAGPPPRAAGVECPTRDQVPARLNATARAANLPRRQLVIALTTSSAM